MIINYTNKHWNTKDSCWPWTVSNMRMISWLRPRCKICSEWFVFSERRSLFTKHPPAPASFIRQYTGELGTSVFWYSKCCSCKTTAFISVLMWSMMVLDSLISMLFKMILFRVGRLWMRCKEIWQILTSLRCHILCVPNHTVCAAHWPAVIRHLIYSFQPDAKPAFPPGR